jgi:hypothetical protein
MNQNTSFENNPNKPKKFVKVASSIEPTAGKKN